MERPLTVREVAEHLSCSERTIMREIRDGRLQAIRVRRKVRIAPEALDDYKRRNIVCPSDDTATVGRSEYPSAMADALSALCRPVLAAQTPEPSKSRSAGGKSKLHAVTSRGGS